MTAQPHTARAAQLAAQAEALGLTVERADQPWGATWVYVNTPANPTNQLVVGFTQTTTGRSRCTATRFRGWTSRGEAVAVRDLGIHLRSLAGAL